VLIFNVVFGFSFFVFTFTNSDKDNSCAILHDSGRIFFINICFTVLTAPCRSRNLSVIWEEQLPPSSGYKQLQLYTDHAKYQKSYIFLSFSIDEMEKYIVETYIKILRRTERRIKHMWDTSKVKIHCEYHILVCVAFSCEQEHDFAKFKTHLSVTFLGITCCCCLSWCHDNVSTRSHTSITRLVDRFLFVMPRLSW